MIIVSILFVGLVGCCSSVGELSKRFKRQSYQQSHSATQILRGESQPGMQLRHSSYVLPPGDDSIYSRAPEIPHDSHYGSASDVVGSQIDVYPTPKLPQVIGHYSPRESVQPASLWGKWWQWSYLRWNAPVFNVLSYPSYSGAAPSGINNRGYRR